MKCITRKRCYDEDHLYILIAYVTITLFTCAMLYPLIYVVSMSVSDPSLVKAGRIIFLPQGITFDAYGTIFQSPLIWNRFRNSAMIVAGTVGLTLLTTIPAAYSLSQHKFRLRKQFMLFFTATMFFSGGLIPQFILIRTLGLYNTRWAVILPACCGAWLLIIAKSYFATIPQSLSEAASIDGANHFNILARIFIPAVKPVMAVLVLYSGVSAWNAYFSAMLYIPDQSKQPIQLYLARVIMQNSQNAMAEELGVFTTQNDFGVLIKYAVVVITILPIMCLYPLLQRYLVGGFMIGSIKE